MNDLDFYSRVAFYVTLSIGLGMIISLGIYYAGAALYRVIDFCLLHAWAKGVAWASRRAKIFDIQVKNECYERSAEIARDALQNFRHETNELNPPGQVLCDAISNRIRSQVQDTYRGEQIWRNWV